LGGQETGREKKEKGDIFSRAGGNSRDALGKGGRIEGSRYFFLHKGRGKNIMGIADPNRRKRGEKGCLILAVLHREKERFHGGSPRGKRKGGTNIFR